VQRFANSIIASVGPRSGLGGLSIGGCLLEGAAYGVQPASQNSKNSGRRGARKERGG